MTTAHAGEPAEEQRQEEMLADLRHQVIRLLAEIPRLPSALRVRIGDVGVELEWNSGTPAVPAPAPAVATSLPAGDTSPPAAQTTAGTEEAAPDTSNFVCAPTVGVFFRAPQPGSPPFVVEGDSVSAGQQVAIIEAMKLFLPVEAEKAGRVTRILAADGGSVEFGERLIAIDDIEP
jgi:acetyl-CoA carboxylase biotin carboxyl carrier protein